MGIDEAFDEHQGTVDEDIEKTKLARERRDLFKKALLGQQDILETIGSGSLSRSTQLKPIHDVDVIAVYDQDQHPQWGSDGPSAEEALEHIRDQVNDLLGKSSGTYANEVRYTLLRNHAVKCFLDEKDDPEAFTVDVMPVLRQADGTLLIPERLSRRWGPANPEYLIDEVAAHQRDWRYFRPLVRVLKQWRLTVPVEGGVKSLVMEVLALNCMPRSGNRSQALKTFFTAAAVRVNEGVHDPADLCGEIQPDLDRAGLSAAFSDAAELADRACAAAAEGNTDDALRLWQKIFGDTFPAPAAQPKPASLISGAPTLITPRPIKDAPQG
ncbi:SMODS domain-containing nucleotidyltransferase [Actinacidiphila glaucinigra]|uniref:SMODS domain-containing nucleotidyltransferase n=1 Tax=Actinacidiphila glaucinigra TaxID=235986 RepID=UPI0036716793